VGIVCAAGKQTRAGVSNPNNAVAS